jgi:response regulator RpfG family c-di-GMP phosphodiesterase
MRLKNDMAITQESVFMNLAEIVEEKNHGEGEHLLRVSQYVGIICEELGMDENEVNMAKKASIMHDIGKLAIPTHLLGKQGKLSDSEYRIVQDHVVYGYNIMAKSPGRLMKIGALIAQQHHEKWNGEGYIGLKGEEINIFARITAIADVFDALVSERSYKEAWSIEDTYAYINSESGKHFDPEVVEAFNCCKDRITEISGS